MLQTRVRTGELDRRVLIVRKVITTPTTNEDAEVGWEPFGFTWARRKDYAGSEYVIADRVTTVHKTVWTMHYRTDISTQMRIIYNTRVYAIISIIENESSRERFIDVETELVDTEFYT